MKEKITIDFALCNIRKTLTVKIIEKKRITDYGNFQAYNQDGKLKS